MTNDAWNRTPFEEAPAAQPYAEGEQPRPLGELVASIADSLARIAKAQEAMVNFAAVDLEATINAEVANRLDEAVNEKIAKTTTRRYLGQKQD